MIGIKTEPINKTRGNTETIGRQATQTIDGQHTEPQIDKAQEPQTKYRNYKHSAETIHTTQKPQTNTTQTIIKQLKSKTDHTQRP